MTTLAKKPVRDDIKTLDAYQATRHVTEMYLSSREPTTECFVNFDGEKLNYEEITFVPALVGSQREIIDNAIDELIGHKGGDTLRVTFDPITLEFSVHDNGRGIPLNKIEEVFTNLHSGRNFDVREDVSGLNGVGSAVVNFTSEYFEVDVWRDGYHYHQIFRESAWEKLDVGKPEKTVAVRKHGTCIKFKPSAKVFPDLTLPESYVKGRLYEIAFQYPNLKVYYNGTKLDGKKLFNGLNPVVVDIERPEHKFKTTFYLIPDFTQENDDHVQPLVNSICTYRGGEFVKTFRSEFYGGIINEIKSRKLTPNRADVAAGLLVLCFARITAAKFDSQAKNYVINKAEAKYVKDGLDDAMYRTIIRKNKDWVENILQRCMDRTKAKDDDAATKASKDAKKKKVAKLVEANSGDRSKCILLIGEGDSALTKATDARNPLYHATLPLTGKIMNVSGEAASKVMANVAIQNLLSSIGLQYNKKAVRQNLRYGKIFIATDEDEDGYHILCLVVNVFYTYWPELFEGNVPFIYKLKTPFIILKKGNDRKYIYADEYDDFDPSKHKGWTITRAKGLGTLEKREWEDVFKDPQVMPILDDERLKETLDLFFNKTRSDDRKDWLNQ